MKMNTDFRDMGHPLTLNTPESGNSYTMSEVELDSQTDIDYNSFTMNSSPSKPIISVARRNERERKRVRLVNQGFAILRDRVPRDRCNRGRRSSKVETLRSAILYIRQLQQLLLESQIRYQDHEMTSCYSYIGDDSYLNPTASSICDSYSSNHGYSQEIFQNSTIPSLRTNSGVQNSNQGYDRHLSVPWFTYNN